MPAFQAFEVPNPGFLPATTATALGASARCYLVYVEPVGHALAPGENVLAWLTEFTRHTMFGPKSAEDFRMGAGVLLSGTKSRLFIVNPETDSRKKLTIVPKVDPNQNPHYLQLGWDVMHRQFQIDRANEGLHLHARDGRCEHV